MNKTWRTEFPKDEVLGWELHKTSLNWELTDQAEKRAVEELGEWFHDADASTDIELTDSAFVVTFTYDASQQPSA